MALNSSRPDIFEFLDYRSFMRAMVDHLKIQNRISARQFACLAGFGSPSYLKMILDGSRRLSEKSWQQVARGLRLTKNEARFFEVLVQFNQANEGIEQDRVYQKLLSFKKFAKIQKTSSDHYEYHSNWYVVALRELLTISNPPKSSDRMAKRLDVKKSQVDDALQVLLRLGLIQENKEVLRANDVALETPMEMRSLIVRNFHRQMLEKSVESIERFSIEERDLSSLTLALPRNKLSEIKKRVAQFRRELNAVFSGDPEAEDVFQINIQIFPLTRPQSEGVDA